MRIKKYLTYPLALLSLLLTHEATYFILYPKTIERNLLLAATGHSWQEDLPLFISALLLLVVYMIWSSRPSLLTKGRVVKLITTQYLAFIAVEVMERLLSGGLGLPDYKILLTALPISILSALFVSLFVEKVLYRILAKFTKDIKPENKLLKISGSFTCATALNLTNASPRSPPFALSYLCKQ